VDSVTALLSQTEVNKSPPLSFYSVHLTDRVWFVAAASASSNSTTTATGTGAGTTTTTDTGAATSTGTDATTEPAAAAAPAPAAEGPLSGLKAKLQKIRLDGQKNKRSL